jgi:hypothetical protein
VEDDDSGGAHSFQRAVLFLDNPPHFLALAQSSSPSSPPQHGEAAIHRAWQ